MSLKSDQQGHHQDQASTTAASSNKGIDDDDNDEHDQEKDDPNQVDDVLSQELMKLSVRNRTEFQEEIHGVRCLAPKETPELLEDSLRSLQWEIDHSIPAEKKEAYLQSQQLPETYVNTDAFRLRFLRCDLFNASKAAFRLTRFLDLAKDLYGDYVLRRPIKLSDFSKSEMKCVRKGHYQFLPYRDRGGVVGRRVLSIFPDCEWELFPPYLRDKIMIYFTWVAGNDVDAQREGIVIVIWFDVTAKVSRKPAFQAKDHETQTIRAAAIHCCSPDTSLYRFRRSIVTMRMGRQNRTRLVVHLGNSVEIRSKLQSYGIAPDQTPITYAGKIKTGYLKQWMKLREYIESTISMNQPRRGYVQQMRFVPPSSLQVHGSMSPVAGTRVPREGSMTSTSSYASSDGSDSGFLSGAFYEESDCPRIESPFLSDIIFRKGISLVSHPGNTNLRTIIEAKARKELLAQDKPKKQQQEPQKQKQQQQTRRFVSEIIQDLRETSLANEAAGIGRACRFLVWDEGGWWTELFQEYEIHTRIEYIARKIRNALAKNHRAGDASAATTAAVATASTVTTNDNTTAVTSEPEANRRGSESATSSVKNRQGSESAASSGLNRRGSLGDSSGFNRRGSLGDSSGYNRRGSLGDSSGYNRRGSLGDSSGFNRRGSELSASSGFNRRGSETSTTSGSLLGYTKPALRRRNSDQLMHRRRGDIDRIARSSVYNRPASENNIASGIKPAGRRRNSLHNAPMYHRRDSETSGTNTSVFRRRGSETSTTSTYTFKRRGSETSTASTAHDHIYHPRRGSETSSTGIPAVAASAPSVISFPTHQDANPGGATGASDIFRYSNHSDPGEFFMREPNPNLKKRRTSLVTTKETSSDVESTTSTSKGDNDDGGEETGGGVETSNQSNEIEVENEDENTEDEVFGMKFQSTNSWSQS